MPDVQIPETLIPCRVCGAAPTEDCVKPKTLKLLERSHRRRVRDAARVSELVTW